MRYLIILCLIGFSFTSGVTQDLNSITTPLWMQDLDFLAQSIKTQHSNPFKHINEEQFNNSISNLNYQMGDLTVEQRLIEMIKIASSIGDGHTRIYAEQYFNYFPIVPFWFDQELRVTKVANEYNEIGGWKITAINGMDIQKVKKITDELTPKGENNHYLLHMSEQWIVNAHVLHYYKIIDDVNQAEFTFQNDIGEQRNITLSSVPFKGLETVYWKSGYKKRPLYMSLENVPLNMYRVDPYTLYLSLNKYAGDKVFKSKVELFMDSLQDHSITHLIIDMRSNDEYNTDQADYLIKKIKKSKFTEHGKIFVITGRKTFSSGAVDALKFKQELGATVMGESPGQRPNSYIESTPITLPNSKIQAGVGSNLVNLQEDSDEYLTLDLEVKQLFITLNEGKDDVIEWILFQP